MTSEDSIRNLLKREIAEKIEVDINSIDEDAHLADLGIDSLQALQLLVVIEREYDLMLEDSDLEHFKSISSVATFVGSRLAAAVAK
jgi:acyl carrier protein